MHRGRFRNVEGEGRGGGGADTVQGRRKQFCIETGTAEGTSSFSRLDWLSYHLCALHALLTG